MHIPSFPAATRIFITLMISFLAPTLATAHDPHHQDDVFIDGKMCIGTEGSPTGGDCVIVSSSSAVHILRSEGTAANLLHLENDGATRILLENTAVGSPFPTNSQWFLNNSNVGTFRLSDEDTVPQVEFELDGDGNLAIAGDLTTAGDYYPDYVFEEDYPLMSMEELAAFIAENKHLPNIPSNSEVERTGTINMSDLQLKLLEKVEELTLYTLSQQETITAQQETITRLTDRLLAIEAALSR